MKRDLYQTLDVSPEASDEEVKRAYRRLAFLYHPDRNPGGSGAEERLKEANYAYSILRDREKRKRYDLYRRVVKQSVRWGVPAFPSHEKILEDLFLDARFPGVGRWLERILDEGGSLSYRNAFRTMSKTTLGAIHRIYQERRKSRHTDTRRSYWIVLFPRGVFEKVGGAFRPFGSRRARDRRAQWDPRSEKSSLDDSGRAKRPSRADIEWTLPLTGQEAAQGTRLTLSFLRDARWERLSLRIPPGIREGVRLRIRNKGNRISSTGQTGDLYLRVLIR